MPDQHEHAQEQSALAEPDDPDGRNRLGQDLRHRIDAGEQKHAHRHQRDAAKAVGAAGGGRRGSLKDRGDGHGGCQ